MVHSCDSGLLQLGHLWFEVLSLNSAPHRQRNILIFMLSILLRRPSGRALLEATARAKGRQALHEFGVLGNAKGGACRKHLGSAAHDITSCRHKALQRLFSNPFPLFLLSKIRKSLQSSQHQNYSEGSHCVHIFRILILYIRMFLAQDINSYYLQSHLRNDRSNAYLLRESVCSSSCHSYHSSCEHAPAMATFIGVSSNYHATV